MRDVGELGNGNGAIRLEGGARDLRRILESLDRFTDGLDEFTQRKVRILVGELVAQARYNGSAPRLGLGLELRDDRVVVEVSRMVDGTAPGQPGGHDSLLSDWSRWLVHSITDESVRAGDRMRFAIWRQNDP